MSFLCILSSFSFTLQQIGNTFMTRISMENVACSTCYMQTPYYFNSDEHKHMPNLWVHHRAICTYVFVLFACFYINFVFSQNPSLDNKNRCVCDVWGIFKSILQSFNPSLLWVLLMSDQACKFCMAGIYSTLYLYETACLYVSNLACAHKSLLVRVERERILCLGTFGFDARRTLQQKHNFNAMPDFLSNKSQTKTNQWNSPPTRLPSTTCTFQRRAVTFNQPFDTKYISEDAGARRCSVNTI